MGSNQTTGNGETKLLLLLLLVFYDSISTLFRWMDIIHMLLSVIHHTTSRGPIKRVQC